MIAWLLWAARAAGSFVVCGCGIVLLGTAAVIPERNLWLMGTAAVLTLAGFLAWPKRPNAWRKDPPTERQIAYARDLGIPIPPGISKGELSDMISQVRSL